MKYLEKLDHNGWLYPNDNKIPVGRYLIQPYSFYEFCLELHLDSTP